MWSQPEYGGLLMYRGEIASFGWVCLLRNDALSVITMHFWFANYGLGIFLKNCVSLLIWHLAQALVSPWEFTSLWCDIKHPCCVDGLSAILLIHSPTWILVLVMGFVVNYLHCRVLNLASEIGSQFLKGWKRDLWQRLYVASKDRTHYCRAKLTCSN